MNIMQHNTNNQGRRHTDAPPKFKINWGRGHYSFTNIRSANELNKNFLNNQGVIIPLK